MERAIIISEFTEYAKGERQRHMSFTGGSTVSKMHKSVQNLQDGLAEYNKNVTAEANRILSDHGDEYPGLKEELIEIGRAHGKPLQPE